MHEISRADFRRHWLTAGPTGSGKTAAVLGRIGRDLTHPCNPATRHIVVDPKGELAQDLGAFLPLFAQQGGFSAGDVNVIAPWRDRLVPLNLCAAGAGSLSRDVRASVTVARIERFIGEQMGNRMKPMLHPVLVAVIGAGGSLETVLRVLEDDETRLRLAARERDPHIKRYIAGGIEKEPSATRQAIVARLRHMLELTPIRRMLGAKTCISGAELLGARVTIVDLGSAPAGQEEVAYALSGWLVSLITSALFARPKTTPQVRLCVDEAQKVVRFAAGDLERTLQEIRWRGATLSLITQSLGQLADHAVRTALLANVGNIFALAPRDEELRVLARYIPEPTGRVVDPDRPDQLLSLADEKKLIAASFRNLPSRTAMFVATDEGVARRLRAPNVPFDEIRRRIRSIPTDVRDAFLSGGIARSSRELKGEQAEPDLGQAPATKVATPKNRRTVRRVELPE